MRMGIFILAVILLLAGCGKSNDAINAAQTKIVSALKSQGIYERGNHGEPAPVPSAIKGEFDILPGTIYRHVVNEQRATRDQGPQIAEGDSIAFMYDARIFTGGSYETQTTFRTNIPARIKELYGNNPDFTGEGWPTVAMRIKVGDDGRILKSLQRALISCRAGDGDPTNDEEEGAVASDRVRVWLTSNHGFGDKWVYLVPPGSTLVYEVTDIEVIK